MTTRDTGDASPGASSSAGPMFESLTAHRSDGQANTGSALFAFSPCARRAADAGDGAVLHVVGFIREGLTPL